MREVLRSGDINLGGGQKSFDPDVHEQATFDYALDFPGYGPALVADGEDAFPIFLELGLFLGEDDHALLVFEFFNQDIDFVADFNGFDVFKFVGGDDTLALIADVHEDFLGTDFNNGTLNNFARRKTHGALPHGFFHRQHNDNSASLFAF